MSDIGHNSGVGELVSFVERIERIQEETDALAEDKKEVFAEAKNAGFDTKILRKVLARRRMDPKERQTLDDLIDTYENALAGH